jgi:hypothetical protein
VNQLNELKNQGYFIADMPDLIPLLNEFRIEIYSVLNSISVNSDLEEIKNDSDVINFRKNNQLIQYLGLKHLYGAPKLYAIAGHSKIFNLLTSLNLSRPIFELPPLLRCDIPIKEQSIFDQHQDYAYNIGSENSLTVWIPLQDTDAETGALMVAPKSHLKGIYPNKKGIISPDYKFDFEPIEVKLGQLLIFNQKLVHKSGVNTSNKIRFSIQLRFSDLNCPIYASQGFPINHRITTDNFLNEI